MTLAAAKNPATAKSPGPFTAEQQSLLDEAFERMPEVWWRCLERQWSARATRKLAYVEGEGIVGGDLLFFLHDYLRPEEGREEARPEALVAKVRRADYSVSDLFMELSAAESALEELLRDKPSGRELLDQLRGRLRELFLRIVDETAAVYEAMTETGGRAYCQVDEEGRIVYANDVMHRLCGVDDAGGTNLAELFGDEGSFVSEVIRGERGPRPTLCQLDVFRPDGCRSAVSAEIAPLRKDGAWCGAYASFTDLSSVRQAQKRGQQRVFKRSLLGIISTDREGRIVYANPKAMEIFGVDSVDGWTLENMPMDGENRDLLRQQFARRMAGESDEYDVVVTRRSDQREIPVNVVSVPELDADDRIVGSFAILRSLEIEEAVKQIHGAIESSRGMKELLYSVAEETLRVIPFDFFSVSIFSEDMRHTRTLFDYAPGGTITWTTRWHEMPDWMVAWAKDPENKVIPDLEEFLDQPGAEKLRAEAGVQALLDRGVTSFIRYPVLIGKRQIASVALGSTTRGLWADVEERLEKIPLSEAVRMALYFMDIADQRFRLELIGRMSECQRIDEMAAVLVKRMAAHYQWHNVAIFSVDETHGVLELEQQKEGPQGFRFHDRRQPLDRGLMGEVYRQKKTLSSPDVHEDERFSDGDFHDQTSSALCVPIKIVGEVRFLLNVEDKNRNAFSREEIADLEEIVRDVVDLVAQLYERYLLEEMLQNASGAIFTTDNKGMIRRANEDAEVLFGLSEEELKQRCLDELFADSKVASWALETQTVHKRVSLAEELGQDRDVFLYGVYLPKSRYYVFFVKDLSKLQQLADAEQIRSMFRDVAAQTRTPISLIYSYLRRLSPDATSEEIADFVDKARRQLRRVELTYERLVLYDRDVGTLPFHPILLDLASVVEGAIRQLPASAARFIEHDVPAELRPFRGDPFQMSFVLQTILGFLLRFVPLDERIRVRAAADDDHLELRISGILPESLESTDPIAPASALAAGPELGPSVIERFVELHRGTYEPPAGRGLSEFRVTLPVAKI